MANEHRNSPFPYKYTCGTPRNACSGSTLSVSHGLSGTSQAHGHSSPEEAFKCHRAHLLGQGYTQLDGRALRPPVGPDGELGEVVILTKPSRFGGMLRGGKGSRSMPNGKHGGNIVSY